MTYTFQTFKPILLGLAILVGIVAQCNKLHAAETRTITVAGGCFWCVESDFEKVQGVIEAVSGFTGGETSNPTYKQVSRGGTGHLEAVQITYDPSQITYEQILHLFFRSIDPTDAGGQFCDRGYIYSTAVFFDTEAEKAAAEAAKTRAARDLGQDVVTQVLALGPFYEADDYHQDYYKQTATILTRFGPISKAKAYKRYRTACGRDAAVEALWGDAAPFVGG